MRKIIYFDNAATSFPKPVCVATAMSEFLALGAGNPGRAGHELARKAEAEVLSARVALAKLLGVSKPERLVFTLNATDALHLAIDGVLKPGDHVVVSPVEHNSVVRPLRLWESRGVGISFASDTTPDAFEACACSETKLFVCSHASNVSGRVNCIDDLAAAAHKRGALMLVDAAQAVGHICVDIDKSGADLVAFSGHKGLLGPTGVGGLFVKDGVDVTPVRLGGTGVMSESEEQPDAFPYRLESGTHNTVGIAGLRAAVEYMLEIGIERVVDEQRAMMEKIIGEISAIEGVSVAGGGCAGGAPLVSVVMDGVDVHDAAAYLDARHGVCVRAGLHCAPHAHRHIGTYPEGTLRISAGIFNTVEEVDILVEALKDAMAALKR